MLGAVVQCFQFIAGGFELDEQFGGIGSAVFAGQFAQFGHPILDHFQSAWVEIQIVAVGAHTGDHVIKPITHIQRLFVQRLQRRIKLRQIADVLGNFCHRFDNGA